MLQLKALVQKEKIGQRTKKINIKIKRVWDLSQILFCFLNPLLNFFLANIVSFISSEFSEILKIKENNFFKEDSI